ncbi:MAG: MATE family efflux transporter [Bacteroidales bacterium]
MNRTVLKLAVPSIFANITVPLVGMVDLAIAGRLGDASLIGGVAVATMLFDLLYWNMGFLRIGTGGLVAQAYGRRDFNDAMRVFTQGIATSLSIVVIIWAIQYLYIELAFSFIECSPQVEALSRDYYFIRIWAAPATLSLFVFKGFFIGMQNAISPMIVDITVNVVNLVASVFFALYAGMGFSGIAAGTVLAQYIGLILAIILMYIYYRKLFKYICIKTSVKLKYIRNFFMINIDLFIRSFCFLFVYAGFTSLAAKYGDTLLAVSTIMMKLMLLYSYFIDGFAYAGEALTGKYVGAKDITSLKKAVKVIFIWCIAIGIVSTFMYYIAGEPLCRLLTNNEDVIREAHQFLPWLLAMPIISCIAFTWDGIFIGATASKTIRNSMIFAVIGFFASYYLLEYYLGIQALWVGFMVHLLIRTIYLSITAKRNVFIKAGEL